LKFLSSRGIFLTAAEGTALEERIAAGAPSFHPWDALGTISRRDDLSAIHVNKILASSLVAGEEIRAAGLKVVVDCVNGAGGPIAALLLERLGTTAVWLHAEPTGIFPRNPEPVPENLAELGAAVVDAAAAIGFALDPDADRVAVVAEDGRAIGEEVTLAVVVDHVLPRVGGDVVVNVSTTLAIDEVATRHGAAVHRTPVGEVNVTEKMLAIGARIGGEGNGGVIVPDVNPGRDGLLGIALVLSALAREGVSVSALANRIPGTVMRKERIDAEGIDVARAVAALRKGLPAARVDETDGLKLVFADSWVHLRRSNTEPVLRLLAEARDAVRVDELVRETRALIEGSRAAGVG
jgi:phosphomannomutase